MNSPIRIAGGRWSVAAIAAVLAAAIFLNLYNLGSPPLIDYDEAQYGLIVHEIVADLPAQAGGDWLSPQFRNHEYFEKPPLYFWLAAIAEIIFGQSEFSLRLPSALAGVGLIAAVMLLVYELSRSRWTAVLAGAILLTMAPVLETARQTRLDVLVTLFIVLAAYAFARALRDSKWFIWFGVFSGLAVMTKSVVAAFAFVAAFVFALALTQGSIKDRLAFFRQKNFWLGIGIFALVALPWHVYELARYGRAFWDVYVGFTIFERTAHALFTVNITNYEYVWYLTNFAVPWMQIVVLGAVAVAVYWRRMDRRVLSSIVACAAVAGSVIAIFFSSTTKAPTYLLPLYPFAAIAIALAAVPVLESWWKGRAGKALVVLAAAVLFGVGLWSTVYSGFHFNPYYAWADELAREEKLVGIWLKENAQGATLYAFGDPNMGSIMYYSGNSYPLKLPPAGGQPPEVGSYIVVPVEAKEELYKQFPHISTKAAFEGKRIELLEVLSGE